MTDTVQWGVSYYPESVPEDEWARDLDHMRGAGLTCLRLLDFAWSALEPREGDYRFEWLDRFMALLPPRGMTAVMCTPTATPPAWLARQYPEAMLAGRDRQPRAWGNRREGDIDSEIYRHFSAEIARRMGERYGHHPAVVGWQIDNELVGSELLAPECHSRTSQFRFRDWLKRHHADPAQLNARWGMRFWNQEFSAWGEIDTPHHDRPCLGHYLDYARYFTESNREYLRIQAQALRAVIAPEQFISHNSTAIFDRGLDHAVFAEALDVVGWDAYFGAASGSAGRYQADFAAMAHDWFRGMKGKPFWVYETNCCPVQVPDAYYAEMIARGACGIQLWHWRGHRAHVEQGSDTVADFAGRPYQDRIDRLHALQARPELAAVRRPPTPRAVLLFSPDEVRADQCPNPYRRGPTDPGYLHVVGASYRALRRLGVAVDVRRPGEDLTDYDLVVAPSLTHLGADAAEQLDAAARAGAVLACCATIAHKDEWGAFHRDLGHPLRDALGCTQRKPSGRRGPDELRWSDERITPCWAWYDDLAAPADATVSARFSDGAEAAYHRPHGDGAVHVLATCSAESALPWLRAAALAAGLAVVDHPHEELGVLIDHDGAWLFNHHPDAVQIGAVSVPGGDFARVELSAIAGALTDPAAQTVRT